MKSLRLIIFVASLGLIAAGNRVLAQEWGPEIQVTTSADDDKNVSVITAYGEIWVFWDRPVNSERQIFYRKINHDGQFIGSEVQLTLGPGSNSLPTIGFPGENGDVGNSEAIMFLCWEHGETPNRDIYFAYYRNDRWSPVQIAFDSPQDEHDPWIAEAWHIINYHYRTDVIVAAIKDSSTVLANYFAYVYNRFELFRERSYPQAASVTSLTCAGGALEMYLCWQTNLPADTVALWVANNLHYNWCTIDTLKAGIYIIRDPKLQVASTNQTIYFKTYYEGFWRVGLINSSSFGTWGMANPDFLNGFQGNQYDPFVTIFDPFWGYNGVFLADANSNKDIVFKYFITTTILSSSDSNDVNPSYVIPNWGWSPMYHRYMVFWESNRSGNWDIYGRFSEAGYGVIPEPGNSVPDKFSVSVFPNPSNAQFRISLDMPHAGWGRVTIWDLAGRRVADIHEGTLAAGNHAFTWNAERQVSGVYVLRAETVQTTRSYKVVLLK
jgi:hypothetical protein